MTVPSERLVSARDETPVRIETHPGRIRIAIEQLIEQYGEALIDLLLERVLTTAVVAAASADRTARTVTIEYDARRHQLADTLTEIARAVEGKSNPGVSGLPGQDTRLSALTHKTRHRDVQRPGTQLVTTGWRRLANLAAAGGCFVISIVGFVTPGIPTVPFILGTSDFLVRSTPTLNARLRHSRVFGALVRDWEDRGGMRASTKLKTIVAMAGLLGTTVLVSGVSLPVLVMTTTVGSVDLLVVLCLPTVTNEKLAHEAEKNCPALLPA